jgi:DNA-binding response OmpR family regulator
MNTTNAERILKTIKALRNSLSAVVAHVDELSDLITQWPMVADAAAPTITVAAAVPLRVDRKSYTVRWGNDCCVLGCTMGFRVLERLALRPNEYVSMDRLLDELWTGPRTYSTVRSTVCRLKGTLRQSGLADLADCVDGSIHGHYGLMLRNE